MRVGTHMALSCITATVLCVVLPPAALAATLVTENISTDTEWTLDGSPYVVNFENTQFFPTILTVTSGATLTIDPGVVVKFGSYNGLSVLGSLVARGTNEHPITFTSLTDDAVAGDTNGDGDGTTPAQEQWMHLDFSSGSRGSFAYVTVRYAGQHEQLVSNTGIANYGGTLNIDHSTLADNGYDGLRQEGGQTVLTHTHIVDHTVGVNLLGGTLTIDDSEIDHATTGILVEGTPTLSVSNSSIHDTGTYAINNQTEIIGYDEFDNPYIVEPGITVDAVHNWWGSASGPDSWMLHGAVSYTPWLTGDPFLPDPCLTPGACPSNVLFLPGIEGSRLYRPDYNGGTDKLWEPSSDADVQDIYLNEDGSSARFDIYAKKGDVLDELPGGANIYRSFIDTMNTLKSDGTIVDWEPIAYDWRLSLDDLLSYGHDIDGRIYYSGDLRATSTPYLVQELRRLAATSRSGKVTIVTHSNGGLLAKALLSSLGGEASKLVDKVMMVGAPQSGAPMAVGALLYGYQQGISIGPIPIVHRYVARSLAHDSPMSYHLLPSEDYLESTLPDLTAHPVIHFSGAGYQKELAAYGPTIANRVALADFLTAKEGGRERPKEKDVASAEVLNDGLINYAVGQHATLDVWYPPSGIEVDQIAGWGVDTLAGLDFYSSPRKLDRLYRPIITEDGDGTVTTPSALQIASSTQVRRLWVSLNLFNQDNNKDLSHANLFEMPQIEEFITSNIRGSQDSLPRYFFPETPDPVAPTKRLLFILHSPLTLELTNSLGEVTGLGRDNTVRQEIPSSSYSELGEVKYIIAPQGEYALTLSGQDTGTFSLDVEELAGATIVASTTIAELPTTASTTARLSIAGGLDTLSPLLVDVDGDTKIDITLAPKLGETVTYEPTRPSAPTPPTGGGGAGAISLPVIAVSVALPHASSTPAATSTPQPARVAAVTKRPTTFIPLPVSEPLHPKPTSQHAGLSRFTAAVYNGWSSFWSIFTKFF